MSQRAFHLERRETRRLIGRTNRRRTELEVVPALRTDRRAVENDRLAVRTIPCLAHHARRHLASDHQRIASEPCARPAYLPALSDQPKSALPRMRDPAATVSTAAFRSPLMTPV